MTRPNLISAKSPSFVVIVIILVTLGAQCRVLAVEGETPIVHFTINEKSIYFYNRIVIF